MSKVKLPNRLKVFINQKLVKQAERENAEFCPVALAIKTKLPKRYKVKVGNGYVDVCNSKNKLVKTYFYNNKTWNKIDNYDDTGVFPSGPVVLDEDGDKI